MSLCSSSDLVLPLLILVTTLSLFFFFFGVFYLCCVIMCVVNTLIKGEIEDRSVRGPVDGRSLVMSD